MVLGVACLPHAERWRPGEERPEIAEKRLEWRPEGASKPFVLDLRALFAEAHGEEPPLSA
jgi:hypothetical protein